MREGTAARLRVRNSDVQGRLVPSGHDLATVVAKVFAHAVEQVARRGLPAMSRDIDWALNVVRDVDRRREEFA